LYDYGKNSYNYFRPHEPIMNAVILTVSRQESKQAKADRVTSQSSSQRKVNRFQWGVELNFQKEFTRLKQKNIHFNN
jgi:hypothetical protein